MGKKFEKGKDKEKVASAKGHTDDGGDDDNRILGSLSKTASPKHSRRPSPNPADFAKHSQKPVSTSSLMKMGHNSKSKKQRHDKLKQESLMKDCVVIDQPHVCSGHFNNDFTELCRRAQMAVIPPVVVRARRPPSPSQVQTNEDKKGGKGKDKNPQPEPEPEELTEGGEPVEPPPKTYVMKEKFEYFKPTVQVEMDNPDKGDTVTEIFVRGWRVDETMMNIFKQCWVVMDKLHTITLWSAGLTSETVKLLGSFLHQCANVKNLCLDGNNLVKEENFDVLLTEESLLQSLSLRYCGLTDAGADRIGKVLGTPQKQNMKLLSLNLTGNKIGDAGATSIAKGLRMNRTLLSLSLASNKIGDVGTKSLAESLSRFCLTHEEVVERRRLMSDKSGAGMERSKSGRPELQFLGSVLGSDHARISVDVKPRSTHDSMVVTDNTKPLVQIHPPPSRRADSKDRPGSVRSSSHADKGKDKTRDKSSKMKKGEKEEKQDKTKGKGAKEDKTLKKDPRGSKASVVVDNTKAATTRGKDKKGKDKKGAVAQESEPETPENLSPLLDVADHVEGGLLIAGNRVLINLNLSRNEIGDEGISSMLTSMQYQTSITSLTKGGPGLMRIALHKNCFNLEAEEVAKLQELMLTKDPFYKPPPSTPEIEQS